MKTMKGWILIGTTLLLVRPVPATDAKPKAEVLDEIIAKVNGAIITRTDLDHARQTMIADLQRRKTPEAEIERILKEREPNLLRDQIDHLLLIQRGEQLDINVDQDVSKYMADLMLQYKIADQDKFAELVRQQTGMRFEDFKEEVKNGFLTQRVLGQEVGSHIVIPKEEIQKYYEEHKKDFIRDERVFLREILISTQGKTGDEIAAAEKKAKDLVARARRGEKFDQLARENSDAVTARNGGDLGGWKKGDLKKDIEDLIWDKEKNYVTDPIRTENGFLILKVIAHHQAGLAPLEEVENEITGKLFEPRFEPKVREYLTELRRNAFLQIKDGYVDTGAAPGKNTKWMDPAKLTPETVSKEEIIRKARRKRLLWLIPIPGTKANPKSSSR